MNAPTDQNDLRTDDWAPCQNGELSCLNQRLRGAAARGQQTRLAGGVAVLAAVMLAVIFWPSPEAGPPRYAGGISCQDCLAAMPAYHSTLTSGDDPAAVRLTADQSLAMAEHFDACPRCRKHFEATYPGVLAGSAAAAGLGWLLFTTHRRRV